MALRRKLLKAALGAAFFFAGAGMASAEGGPARALLDAAAKGDVAQIEKSLAAGVKVDARDAQGRTPLLLATHNNRVEAARVLIGAGGTIAATEGTDVSLPAGTILRVRLDTPPNIR